jgi:hypothetical protein
MDTIHQAAALAKMLSPLRSGGRTPKKLYGVESDIQRD